MQIENMGGYGFPWRVCTMSLKKEKTWCAVLGDFRSRIKYSSTPHGNMIGMAMAQMAPHTLPTAMAIRACST